MGAAHLVSDFATPLYHFRNGLLVHPLSRLSDGVHDGEIGLQRVERLHGGLWTISRVLDGSCHSTAYSVIALRHDGEAVVRTGEVSDSAWAQLPCNLRH